MPGSRSLLATVLGLAMALSARAEESPAACLARAVLEGIINKNYQPGLCCRNAQEVLLSLQERGVDTRGARILYVLYEKRLVMGIPAEMPLQASVPLRLLPDGGTMAYHAILELKGEIYDPDYRVEAVARQAYFDAVFGGGLPSTAKARAQPDRLAATFLRVIPAEDYLKAFAEADQVARDSIGKRTVIATDVVAKRYRDRTGESPYPVMSVRDYLAQP